MEKLFTRAGSPLPFGAFFQKEGVNFSLFSKNASAVTLALFSPHEEKPFAKIALDPHANRTGDIWHIFVSPLQEELHYGYYVDGPQGPLYKYDVTKLLIDPYAKLLSQSNEWGKEEGLLRSVLQPVDPFDWEGDQSPCIPLEEMILYEMHVRGFTKDPSSKCQFPGTFKGIIEKIPYLKALGINAIELLPIHLFNECEYVRRLPGETLYNYWGYSTINFFAPMNRYAVNAKNVLQEFQEMVKELHKAKIEVILDVVFNHTAEGNAEGPILSFKGLENEIYYMLDSDGNYMNFSGCGNTFNCNHPAVRELIRTSLRYWAAEMHVDGFRFDLASILGRASNGAPMSNPPLLEMIALDPVLSKVKLIAEAWDAGGLYQVGSFPSWGVWAEWNGKWRDHVRNFIKGTDNSVGFFATRLCGSPDLYANGRTPGHSINFITCHDGFCLHDLVSYNQKHNEANAEDNRDGSDENLSWNCGIEGPTDNQEVLSLRKRQMKNFMVALLVSQGPPMIFMGDEVAGAKQGNNNTWCHDNALNWLPWEKTDQEFFRFVSSLIQFRQRHVLFKQKQFLTDEEICWHGHNPKQPDWTPQSRFLAFTLFDKFTEQHLYIAFNAHYYEAPIELPTPPKGKKWHRIVDTNLPSPSDFTHEKEVGAHQVHSYTLMPHSSIILKAF